MEETVPSFDLLLQALQRDINCLTDSNRGTRSSALDRFRKRLFPLHNGKATVWCSLVLSSGEPEIFLERLLHEHLANILLRLCDDPVESCRSISMDIFAKICDHCPSAIVYLRQLSALAARRLGQQQTMEPAEELRVALLQLINIFWKIPCAAVKRRDMPSLIASIEHLVPTVCRVLADPFPELKKEACQTIEFLCNFYIDLAGQEELVSYDMRLFHSQMAIAVAFNLSHQRYQIRIVTLQALFDIIIADARYADNGLRSWVEPLLDTFLALTNDRLPAVRLTMINLVHMVVRRLIGLTAVHRSKFLLLLLAGLADSVDVNCVKAAEALEDIALAVAGLPCSPIPIIASTALTPAAATSSSNSTLTSVCTPFACLTWTAPSDCTHRLVSGALDDLMAPLLLDLSDWTVARRLRGAGILTMVVHTTRLALVPFLPAVLAAVARISHDDDPAVRARVLDCCALIGSCLPVDLTLSYLYAACGLTPEPTALRSTNSSVAHSSLSYVAAHTQQTSGGNSCFPAPVAINSSTTAIMSDAGDKSMSVSVYQIANALSVMAGVIRGCSEDAERLRSVMPTLCVHLARGELAAHDSAVIRLHLLAVLQSMLAVTRIDTLVMLKAVDSLNSDIADSPKVDMGFNSCDGWMFWALLQLDALAEDAATSQAIYASFEKLGLLCHYGTTADLFTAHFGASLQRLTDTRFSILSSAVAYSAPVPHYEQFTGGEQSSVMNAAMATTAVSAIDEDIAHLPVSQWSSQHPQRFLFSSLCRHSVHGVMNHVEQLLPLFIATAHPLADPALRLSCMALLEFIFTRPPEPVNVMSDSKPVGGVMTEEDTRVAQSWHPWMDSMLRSVLLPSLRWRSGRVAASIRRHALQALNAILDRPLLLPPELLTRRTLFTPLLAALTASLDDSDALIRLQCSKAMRLVFLITNEKLDDIALVNVYRDLLKRLDDSNDEVRLDICQTLVAYLHVINTATLDRSCYKYLVRGFLVHLDDPSVRIQDAAFELLAQWRFIDPYVFYPEVCPSICRISPVFNLIVSVQAVRDRHSHSTLCDRLLLLAKQL